MMNKHRESFPLDDPDRMLGVARALIVAAADPDACDTARELADLLDALDEWLRAGGPLPSDWAHAERRRGERRHPFREAALTAC